MPLCLVFDLDDTLYPEIQFVVSGMAAVAAYIEHAYDRHDASDVVTQIQAESDKYQGRMFDTILKHLGIEANEEAVQRLVRVYRYHQPTLRLHEDAEALLALLSDRVELAMVTDGWERVQRNKLDALGVAHRFRPVVCTFDRGVAWHKPSTLPFSEVERLRGGSTRQFAYIADNAAKDFGGPSEMGWMTIHIMRPNGIHYGKSGTHRIDVVVKDLRHIMDALNI